MATPTRPHTTLPRVLKVHWFLPTGGDGRDVAPAPEDLRPPTVGYLFQVASACDQLGFDAVLTPCGTACEDAWLATAPLIPLTRHLRFLVAFRPGLLSPTLAAQMASTYQRMSGGRLLVNIVIGAEDHEVARFGDFADKDTRYERAGEFLAIMRAAWDTDGPGTPGADFDGDHYRVVDATTRARPTPRPEIYFGGASPAAERIAAEHVDVYLAWGEPPTMVAERLDRMRELAAAADRGADRPLRFGIRFHAITRDTEDEAWTEASRLLAGMDPAAVAAARADFAQTRSVGQARMAGLSGAAGGEVPDDPRDLLVHDNVWAGVGLVRGGAGTALVGSHTQVADRIEEYAALGFEEFILSGYPHLEEAWATGEGLLPELRRRGLLDELPDAAPVGRASTFR
ncbi:MAG: LLM class flavin-dependent oxidoreductase [Actinobacteria bacterium]|nr:LLM class flavin-dependent oxidoreductase [Actinomycetota bacterium]